MIKNIVFDMGNVLLAYTPQEYVKTVTQDENAAQAVLKELFGAQEWCQLDAGSITEEEAVRQVSSRIPQYADTVRKAMDLWHSNLTPVKGMPELVKRLKDKGYGIYLLSNTSLRFYRYRDKVEMFRMFDGFLVSAKEKLLKPDPAIFRRFCERFSVAPGECLFIDDLAQNIEGAEQVGFQGHRFCGAEELEQYLTGRGVL